jgi:hypothetical protein
MQILKRGQIPLGFFWPNCKGHYVPSICTSYIR